jgi:hypothetical protein
MAYTLLTEETDDVSSGIYTLSNPVGAVAVFGTFDDATVTIEASLDKENFVTVKEITSEELLRFELVKNAHIRATISSAGAGTELTVQLQLES